MACPLFKLKRIRDKWLDTPVSIRKATPHKSIRITWADGNTAVSANFYEKGIQKSQVAVQHGKLKSAQEAEAMKAFWKERLGRLKTILD